MHAGADGGMEMGRKEGIFEADLVPASGNSHC